jgi:hypothetical protein
MAGLASCSAGHGVEPGAKLTFELDHSVPAADRMHGMDHGCQPIAAPRLGSDFAALIGEGPVLMVDDWAASLVRIQKRNNIREKRHA